MATIFDSNTADTEVSGFVVLDTGARFNAGEWFTGSFAPLNSLSDAKTLLGIVDEMPNIALVTTADATDEATALTLVNANKAKINELIQVMINIGLIASA